MLLWNKDQAKAKIIFTQKNNSANAEITTIAELCLVPLTGLEPVRCRQRGILRNIAYLEFVDILKNSVKLFNQQTAIIRCL